MQCRCCGHAQPSVAPQFPHWPRGIKQRHPHRRMGEMEDGSTDAEGIWSSLLYFLGWKMSLHLNFVKSQPAVSVPAGVLQIKNGLWVYVCAWRWGWGCGGLSEVICSSGKKPVHGRSARRRRLSFHSSHLHVFHLLCYCRHFLPPKCLIEALFRQLKAGGAILRAVQAGFFFSFVSFFRLVIVPGCVSCSLCEKLYLQDSASPTPAL